MSNDLKWLLFTECVHYEYIYQMEEIDELELEFLRAINELEVK